MHQYILEEDNDNITLVTTRDDGSLLSLTFGHKPPSWWFWTHNTEFFEQNIYTIMAKEKQKYRQQLKDSKISKEMERSIETMIEQTVDGAVKKLFSP